MARNRKKLFKNVTISGIADKGRAVGRTEEGIVLFVEGAVPGDVMDVLTYKKKKGIFIGVPDTYHKKSEDRQEPICQHFGECGGCKWQHLKYSGQLIHKDKVVQDAFRRIAKVEVGEFLPILGAEKIYHYRNKIEYSFLSKKWIPQEIIDKGEEVDFKNGLGFHRAGAFDKVVDIETCHLQNEPSNDIRNTLRQYTKDWNISYYDVKTHEGFMRNIFLRNNRKGEWMVNLIVAKDQKDILFPMLEMLLVKFPMIKSLWYTVNEKVNDSIFDLEVIHYGGNKFLDESLGKVKFQIGPKSFFQTNTHQAEVLYATTAEFAGLTGNENVYDLYTGLGSIALYIADRCNHVVGIEEIEAAIEDAHKNKELNGISNATFYAGDVKNILTDDFAKKHGKPDLLITDPPRAGMHKGVVEMLLKLESPKIVYVSCNPATQARDVQILSEKYTITKVQPVDMFPQTHHIENVALLELKK